MINYQKKTDEILETLSGKPKLLLHSCCAPCSSYVMEYLSQYFQITILYYNPNITDPAEYQTRLAEQKRLISEMQTANPVMLLEGRYDPALYLSAISGLEGEPEGGKRCTVCYALRMEEAAQTAKEKGLDYFTTTLSISPHKNAQKLNEIGEALSEKYEIPYLYADFKKREGYKHSIQLSQQFHLYRQDFCGCTYSVKNKITD